VVNEEERRKIEISSPHSQSSGPSPDVSPSVRRDDQVLSLLEANLKVLAAMAGIEAQWALLRLQGSLGLDVDVSKVQAQMELLIQLLEAVAPMTSCSDAGYVDTLAPLREQLEETADLLARRVAVEEESLEPPLVTAGGETAVSDGSQIAPPEELQKEWLVRVTATSDSDPWGIVRNLDSVLDQYSRHSHLLLPRFWAEACRELHRYSSVQVARLNQVARLPATEIDTIVRRLLKEAPAARLLQYMRRKRLDAGADLDRDQVLTYDEIHTVRSAVRDFFEEINDNLDPSGTPVVRIEEWRQQAAEAERDFDLGPAELESRISKMIQDQLRRTAEILASFGAETDSLDFLVRAQTIILVSRLNNELLELPRLRLVLTEMKT